MSGPVNVQATSSEKGELVFDSEFLRKLERLELVARKVFRGLLRGEHTTHRRGRGLELSDFRRYRPGDDFRHIDWNIFSRLDMFFLKLYASDEDMALHLLLDTSASMDFGTPGKFDYARRLVVALGFIGLNNLDRVGVATFSERLGPRLPALKAKHGMAALVRFVAGLHTGQRTRFEASLAEFANAARSPGLVVVVSDLMGGDDAQAGLEALRRRGHEVVVLQVLSEEEIDPPLDGALRLIDAEEGGAFEVTVDAELRALYRRRLGRHLDDIERYCRSHDIDYLRTSTAIAFEDVVLKYLRQGANLR